MKYLFALLLISSTIFAKQQIALTFDDFPMPASRLHKKIERVQLYMDKLEKLNIQAAFFCIGNQYESNCVQLAAENNQLLANHSFFHNHLSKQSIDAFKQELLEADAYLSKSETYRKWYRFPYLDYGDRVQNGGSKQKRVAAFHCLRKAGFSHGYATINTFDWYVNHLMLKAIKENPSVDLEVYKRGYLALLKGWIESYHKSWKKCYKRPFCHVLLLHQNDLNLLFLEDIVDMIHTMGWEIVSPDVAYNSPLVILSKWGSTFPKFKHPSTLSIDYIDNLFTR